LTAGLPNSKSARCAYFLKDAARAMLDNAVSASAVDGDQAVHDVRKDLKRARAALRLLRGTIGATLYRDANRRLRDAAVPLRPLRDATAMLDTLRKLAKSWDNDGVEARRFRDHLYSIRESARGRCTRQARQLEAARIQYVSSEIEQMPIRAAAPVSARRGISKTYKDGREAYARAQRRATISALHELRKQAKYLANELQLAKDVFRLKFKKERRRAHKLAVVLGDDHDLAMLKGKLLEWRAAQRGPQGNVHLKDLSERIDSERDRLQAKARRQGKKLYRQSVRQLRASIKHDMH
jgi:CHAD domain